MAGHPADETEVAPRDRRTSDPTRTTALPPPLREIEGGTAIVYPRELLP
ncbi:hypothetical protein [Streptomyces chartreusis]